MEKVILLDPQQKHYSFKLFTLQHWFCVIHLDFDFSFISTKNNRLYFTSV